MTPEVYYITPLMLALYVPEVRTIEVEQCGQTYQSPIGLTCFYCAPGTHKVEDCLTNYTGALCITCPAKTYQRDCNRANHCELCDPRCTARYTTKVKNCTLYEDIVCQCIEGRFWHNETKNDGVCLSHNRCRIGYGMVNLGTPHRDTQCEKCMAGETFSGTESFERCSPCTKCEVYKTPCTTERDAECIVAWTNRSASASVEPTQKTDCNTGLIAGMVVLSVFFMSLLAFVVFERCKRHARFCPWSEEDGTQDKDPPKTSPNPDLQDEPTVPNDGADRGPEPPDNPEDQPAADPAPEQPTRYPQDSDNPPSDLDEDDGTEGGLDTLEDQNAGESTSIAPTSGDPQNDEGATSADEHDVQPDDITQQPCAPEGIVISLNDTKGEAKVTAAFKCTGNGSVDMLSKIQNDISQQREEENSNLHATEEGEGSMKNTMPVSDKHARLAARIDQPIESTAHSQYYSSPRYAPVHEDPKTSANGYVKMDLLKEREVTKQGREGEHQLSRFEDSSYQHDASIV